MAQTSPAEIKIPSLHQIGIVVKDLDKTVKDYWEILGIGPWTILGMKPPAVYDRAYHGKPASFEIKAAFAQVGDVELELMQTMAGHTAYDDFSAQHGEGANHLQYLVDSAEIIDKHAEIMAKKGFPSLMSGRFGNNGGFNYLDTVNALGTIWEPVKMADEFSGDTTIYPANKAEVSPAKIKIKALTQIALVVKDLEKSMANYWNILGVGPWDICEGVPPTFHDLAYHGKPGSYTMRIAFARPGPVELELIQPLSGDNVFSDFLERHGEGLHHVQFLVDDIDKTTEIMTKEGFPTLMGGGFSDGAFAYYDTVKPLKIIWEAVQLPKTYPPMTRYP
jgi:catechol 2,3-dioxygenase-like lactoylglutathione lyase family enzyme